MVISPTVWPMDAACFIGLVCNKISSIRADVHKTLVNHKKSNRIHTLLGHLQYVGSIYFDVSGIITPS